MWAMRKNCRPPSDLPNHTFLATFIIELTFNAFKVSSKKYNKKFETLLIF